MFVYVIYGHPFKLGASTSPGSTASSPRPSAPLRRISALSAAPGNQRASVSSLGELPLCSRLASTSNRAEYYCPTAMPACCTARALLASAAARPRAPHRRRPSLPGLAKARP